MGRPSRHLITIPWIVCAGWLAFYGELQAAFNNIGRLDSRMSMARNRHSRIHFCINDYRHITWNRTVRLRQNLPAKAGRSCGRRTLRRCVSRNESRKSADCAGRKTRKSSPCQHGDLPAISGSRVSGLLQTRIICRPYLGEQVGLRRSLVISAAQFGRHSAVGSRGGDGVVQCPLWVKSGHCAVSGRCRLYPQKRTSLSTAAIAKRTSGFSHWLDL